MNIGPQSEIEFLGSYQVLFRSIRVQIRIPCGQVRQIQPFAYFETRSFTTFARTGVHALTTKKSLLLHRWLKSARFFFAHLFIQIASHEQPWGSHGATRIAACSSRSPLSRTREKIFTPAVQGMKNAHLQQANASVCGRKISSDPPA